MTQLLTIEHVTTYRYVRPVTFGEHRLFCRPRDGYDIRVLETTVVVTPSADIRWIQDVFSNWVAIFTPLGASDALHVVARITVAREAVSALEFPLEAHAERYPFDYSGDERRDLGALLDPHYGDPNGRLYAWTRQFFAGDPRPPTRELIRSMSQAIRDQFDYDERPEEGIQSPDETLRLGAGSCRDYALLMMEALRRLGIAARFVSGYLYDPAQNLEGDVHAVTDELPMVQGAGTTHAWMQAFLPGAGWVSFDPTNPVTGDAQLVRVAYARDPAQIPPLSGAWFGAKEDAHDMEVRVTVI